MAPTARRCTPGVMVSMETDLRPVLETPLTRDPTKCVIAYTRDDGHYDVWVYARDVRSGALGRCIAYRTFRKGPSDKWDLRYEIGDLDEKTRVALQAMVMKSLPT